MNGIKNFKNMYSILTICLILVGAVLLIAPGIALDVVCIIFGIYMICLLYTSPSPRDTR